MHSQKHLCVARLKVGLFGVSKEWHGSSPLFPKRGAPGPCSKGTRSSEDSEAPVPDDLEEEREMEGEAAAVSWGEATACCL